MCIGGKTRKGFQKRPEAESLTIGCQRSGARCIGEDVEDFTCGSIGIQICDCGGSGTAFIQEDECDVVRLFELI